MEAEGSSQEGILAPATVTARLLHGVARALAVPHVALHRLDDTGDAVCVAVGGGARTVEWIGQRVPAGTSLVGRAIADRGPVSSSDVLADARLTVPEGARAAWQAEGLGGTLAVPVVADGVVLGALMVGDRPGRVFEPAHVGLGLASVYGVVRQNHGAIVVDSRPDARHGVPYLSASGGRRPGRHPRRRARRCLRGRPTAPRHRARRGGRRRGSRSGPRGARRARLHRAPRPVGGRGPPDHRRARRADRAAPRDAPCQRPGRRRTPPACPSRYPRALHVRAPRADPQPPRNGGHRPHRPPEAVHGRRAPWARFAACWRHRASRRPTTRRPASACPRSSSDTRTAPC